MQRSMIAHLCARMKAFVDLPEAFSNDVGINLGGGNVLMPQHHLHGPQIGASIEQMRCKRMPKDVGRYVLSNFGPCGITLDNLPEFKPRQRRPPAGKEKVFGCEFPSACFQITFHCTASRLSQRNDPLLASLPETAHESGLQIHSVDSKTGKFRNPQAGGI